MPDHSLTLDSILAGARGDLRHRWANCKDDFGICGEGVSDIVHEIADSCVPVYTRELFALACEDNGLATDVPEVGPAFDGSPTPVNIIAANVYERVSCDLFDEFEKIRSEYAEWAAENADEV